jgi:hypothetical protein
MLTHKGRFSGNELSVETMLQLVQWSDSDGIFHVFAPALDVAGYGNSESEAMQSFNITLKEFLRYSINKGTLQDELTRLGWKMGGRKTDRRFKLPAFDELIRRNEELRQVVSTRDFQVRQETVSLPAFA